MRTHIFRVILTHAVRVTIVVQVEPEVIGIGDAPDKKDAEQLAYKSAAYQLYDKGFVSVVLRFDLYLIRVLALQRRSDHQALRQCRSHIRRRKKLHGLLLSSLLLYFP